MNFVELTQPEVQELDFACNNFLQSWEMYQRYQSLGRESYFMGLKDTQGQVLAAGLLLARPWHFGKKVFRVAGGWLMDYEHQDYSEVLGKITAQARAFCQQKQGIALEIAPNLMAQPRDAHNQIIEGKDNLAVKTTLERLGYKYLGEYEQVKWTFVKDLQGEQPEEMFKAFRTDHRQRIRRAEREQVRIRELAENELQVLKEIAAEAGERHGFQDPDLEYYRSMKQAFGPKVKFVVAEIPSERLKNGENSAKTDQRSVAENSARTEVKSTKLDDKHKGNDQRSVLAESEAAKTYTPLAAAMFVNDGREMVYLYSGSVRKLQKYGGAHLIQWQMLQEALRSGCQKYNFYGVYPVEGNGVYNFKLGFRGRIEELLGTFILPIGFLGKLYVGRLKSRIYGEIH